MTESQTILSVLATRKRAAVLGRVVKAKQALDKACDDADDVLVRAQLSRLQKRHTLQCLPYNQIVTSCYNPIGGECLPSHVICEDIVVEHPLCLCVCPPTCCVLSGQPVWDWQPHQIVLGGSAHQVLLQLRRCCVSGQRLEAPQPVQATCGSLGCRVKLIGP